MYCLFTSLKRFYFYPNVNLHAFAMCESTIDMQHIPATALFNSFTLRPNASNNPRLFCVRFKRLIDINKNQNDRDRRPHVNYHIPYTGSFLAMNSCLYRIRCLIRLPHRMSYAQNISHCKEEEKYFDRSTES